ncbi:MAG: hypothetical protein D6826_10940 [Alphaproteobacteria bacterium]|nr:MAG: hypothetical protein D6826_10940 [Alphaproteobacteria bacterium]
MSRTRQPRRIAAPWAGRAAILIAGALSLLLPPAAPLRAQATDPADDAARYSACMERARTAPQAAFTEAEAWSAQTSALPARHCAAVALIGLGRTVEAAQRLGALAADVPEAATALRAELLAQSAQAWMMAGEAARAIAALTTALALQPDNVEMLIDRSIALASAGRYWEAVDDLNRALDLAPDRPDILVLRASAYRSLDADDLAADDLARALARDPDNLEALLERGLLRQRAGDVAGARADWQRILALATRGPAAAAARRNLQALESASR